MKSYRLTFEICLLDSTSIVLQELVTGSLPSRHADSRLREWTTHGVKSPERTRFYPAHMIKWVEWRAEEA